MRKSVHLVELHVHVYMYHDARFRECEVWKLIFTSRPLRSALCVQSMLVVLSTFYSYMLLHKRSAFDLSSVYINWFGSFLTNREFAARIYLIVSFFLACFLVSTGILFWGLFSTLVGFLNVLGWNLPLINRTATVSYLQLDKNSKTIT
jgi:hypothetical protein